MSVTFEFNGEWIEALAHALDFYEVRARVRVSVAL